jgi:hypothetical protein
MKGRWGSKSSGSPPTFWASSSSDPIHSTSSGVLIIHPDREGGVPQKRSRERAQSTLLASHSPKRPSPTSGGCQVTVRLFRASGLLQGGRGGKPRIPRHVDEGRAAAPAVRIGVGLHPVAEEVARGPEGLHQDGIRLLHEHPHPPGECLRQSTPDHRRGGASGIRGAAPRRSHRPQRPGPCGQSRSRHRRKQSSPPTTFHPPSASAGVMATRSRGRA